MTGLGGRGLFGLDPNNDGPAAAGATVTGLLFPPCPIFKIAGRDSRFVCTGVASTAAAEGVLGRSLNPGTEEEIRWRLEAAETGGLEVKALPI